MKEIYEIITKIEDIFKEQATTDLSEEEKADLESLLNIVEVQIEDSNIQVGAATSSSTCCNQVPFCCTVDIPNQFNLVNISDPTINFVSCLSCVTGQPCNFQIPLGNCDPITVSVFPIKATGCIQFIIHATAQFDNTCTVTGFGNTCPSKNGKADICCQGSVCIDQIINFTSNSTPQSNPIPCDVIQVCFNSPEIINCVTGVQTSGKSIRFSGRFILPTTCPPPTTCVPTTCPPTCVPTTTCPPTICPPTTCPPTTCPPTTCPPTTCPPTTCPPTTCPPTTCPPTTCPPC